MLPPWLDIVSRIATIVSAVVAVGAAIAARHDLRTIQKVTQAVTSSPQSVNIGTANTVTIVPAGTNVGSSSGSPQ